MQAPNVTPTTPSGFPFKLEDLVSWTVRRTDGTCTMFHLTDAGAETEIRKVTGKVIDAFPQVPTTNRVENSLGKYCSHYPKDKFLFEGGDGLKLAVGDFTGARADWDEFDFVIDCGDVLDYKKSSSRLLAGDDELVKALSPHTLDVAFDSRILKIDWFDRKAPDVLPAFWTELNKLIYGKVMTCCVGGHGRSGTSFVCLLLNNAPDYDALDAIVHLRAVHCPRAIESVVQHEYIDDVAKFLGREANAREAVKIKDYKAAFKASMKPTAIEARKKLGWD